MPLFDPILCPTCRTVLPIAAAWKLAPKARGLFLLHKTGVACPGCGARFALVTGRTVLASAAILLGAGGVLGWNYKSLQAQWLAPLPQWQQMGAILTLLAPFIIFQVWLAPQLLRVRQLESNEVAEFPLERDRASGI